MPRWKIDPDEAYPTHSLMKRAGSALRSRLPGFGGGTDLLGAPAPRSGSHPGPAQGASPQGAHTASESPQPQVSHFDPTSYWMSSPSEASRLGVPNVWHKSGGYDLPDDDRL